MILVIPYMNPPSKAMYNQENDVSTTQCKHCRIRSQGGPVPDVRYRNLNEFICSECIIGSLSHIQASNFSQPIPLPQTSHISRIDTPRSIKDFLEYLINTKGKSYNDISVGVNSQVRIDERVPHPLTKDKNLVNNNISGYNNIFGVNSISINFPKPKPLGFEIDKFSWPKSKAIKDFATNKEHCSSNEAGMAKRNFLWEKLKRAYEHDFNEFGRTIQPEMNLTNQEIQEFPYVIKQENATEQYVNTRSNHNGLQVNGLINAIGENVIDGNINIVNHPGERINDVLDAQEIINLISQLENVHINNK